MALGLRGRFPLERDRQVGVPEESSEMDDIQDFAAATEEQDLLAAGMMSGIEDAPEPALLEMAAEESPSAGLSVR